MHVLFQVHVAEENEDMVDTISLDALKAAIDFIQTSLQHTCYIAGRYTIAEEVDMVQASKNRSIKINNCTN